ncbi:MAG: hypothetical protein AAGF92_02015 [Myxococcota bacterium]
MPSFLSIVTCALLAATVLPSPAAAQNTTAPSKWNSRSFTALSWAVYTYDEALPSSADNQTPEADAADAAAPADAADAAAPADAAETDPDPPEPRECKPRYMVGPGLGIPLGAGSLIGGAIFTAIGVGTFGSTEPKVIGIGAAMLTVGLGTLAFSMVKLRRNRERRLELCGRRMEPADWRR